MEIQGVLSTLKLEALQWSGSMQDGISMLKNLEVLEIVGARSLRLEPGIGRLANLKSLELNSCE